MNKYITILLFCFTGVVFGQRIAGLEEQYQRLNQRHAALMREIDSLSARMQAKVRVVRQKEQAAADKTKLQTLTAEAFELSRQRQEKKKEAADIAERLAALRQRLYQLYSKKIDSLQAVKKKSGLTPDQDRQLSLLIYRRLAYAPQLPPLSFDPGKILQIDLSRSKDTLEQSILRDYLQTSLRQVDRQLRILRQKEDEIQTMARLQNKTEEFFDEVGEGPVMAPGRESSVKAASETSNSYGNSDVRLSEKTPYTQQINIWLAQLSAAGLLDQNETGSDRNFDALLRELKTAEQNIRQLRQLIVRKLTPEPKTNTK